MCAERQGTRRKFAAYPRQRALQQLQLGSTAQGCPAASSPRPKPKICSKVQQHPPAGRRRDRCMEVEERYKKLKTKYDNMMAHDHPSPQVQVRGRAGGGAGAGLGGGVGRAGLDARRSAACPS